MARWCWSAVSPVLTPRLGAAAAFLFAYRVMPTAMVTFTTFTYAQFTMANSGYAGLLLVSMGAGILATMMYGRMSFDVSLSRTFIIGAVADAVFGLARLIVIAEWDGNEDVKSDAPVGALVASNVLTAFGGMMGYMPILALAARCAPRDLEATGYSALLFVADLATGMGSLLAAELTRGMGLGAGEDRSWSGLDAYVWICAALKLLPLALLPMLRGRGIDEEGDGTAVLRTWNWTRACAGSGGTGRRCFEMHPRRRTSFSSHTAPR